MTAESSGKVPAWSGRGALAACMLAACTSLALGAAETPRDAAAYLPQDTILCLQVAPWREWARDWDQTSLAKVCQETELRNFLAGPWNRLRDVLGAPPPAGGAPAGAAAPSTIGSFFRTLADVAAGPMVAALCYSDEDAQAKAPLGVAVVIGTEDIEKMPRASLAAELTRILINYVGSDVVKQEAYGAANLIVVQGQKLQPTLCFFKNNLVLTSRPGLCKQIVDGLSGTLARKLSEKDSYRASMPAVAQHKSVYLDVQGLRRALGAQPAKAGKVNELLAQAGLEDMQALAWSLRMDGLAFESRAAFLSAGPRKGWLAALGDEPLRADRLQTCRAGCSFAVGVRLKPDHLLACLTELLRRTVGKEEADRLAAVEKKLAAEGRDLGRDLAAAFGTQLTLTNYRTREGAPPGALVTMLGSVEMRDAAKAEALMVDVMKRMAAQRGGQAKPEESVKTIPCEDGKILYLEPPAGFTGMGPVFALSGSQLVVALDIQTLKSAVLRLKEPGLAAEEGFQTALKGVGCGLGSFFLYVDYAQVYQSVFDLGATALKFLGALVPLRDLGLDLALLPSPEVVTRHLFPALVVLETKENGAALTSRGPLPSPEVLAPPMAASAAVVGTLSAELGGAEEPAEKK